MTKTISATHYISPYVIGQTVPRKGIFGGIYEPQAQPGESLGRKYNIFSDLKDLTDRNSKKLLLTWEQATEEIGKSNPNGRILANETDIHRALADGSYQGERFIPTKEILHGRKYPWGKNSGQ